MKINSMGPREVASNYAASVASQTAAAKGSPKINGPKADTVELSEGAQQYSALLKAAKKTMEQAEQAELARVAQVREQIQNGTYRVSDDALVDSILRGFPSGE